MGQAIIRIILPLSLLGVVATIVYNQFQGIGLEFDILQEIFIFIKSAMYSFDWLIPYTTQLLVINTFIFVELGLLTYKVVRFMMKFFGLSYEKSDNE